MTYNEAFNQFKNYLFATPDIKARETSNGWINIRGDRICPHCSKHRDRSALYILMIPNQPIFLNCFRASCDIKRRMTERDFKEFGFTNMDVISTILIESQNKQGKAIKSSDSKEVIIRNRLISDTQRKYLYDRTHIDFTLNDIYKYRFIPDLREVLSDNFGNTKLNLPYGNAKYWASFADDAYNVFTIRGILPKDSRIKRMVKVDQDKRFLGYTLQNGKTKDLDTLVIAEGVFDIINIHKWFADLNHGFYVATLGFGNTFDLIKYYSAKFTTIRTLIVFADSDQQNDYGQYTYMKRIFDNLFNKVKRKIGVFEEIWIAYNKKSKDFGDLREPLGPEKIKIL